MDLGELYRSNCTPHLEFSSCSSFVKENEADKLIRLALSKGNSKKYCSPGENVNKEVRRG